MDVVQDWASYLLHTSPNMLPYVGQIYTLTSTARSYILPLIDRVAQKPDLATIALLLIILFVSLKILNMLWQAVMFWVRLAKTIIFWGGLGALAIWVYNRGPDGMMEDVSYWTEVWQQEHHYWKEQEREARRMARQKPMW
ncbi:hypothetical protein K431DRAFT_244366 [Polychaeton citri CBS 116435]|uniref:Uncharacterized protein n=1 Tax=Polychaeton citri CBS 116435 TaxID=1314669 RepID=A0A9P4UNV9_9PEZI|nr:hypothetical protein K431DRAFT_244366 [Polychaeton citri CBS 116435]